MDNPRSGTSVSVLVSLYGPAAGHLEKIVTGESGPYAYVRNRCTSHANGRRRIVMHPADGSWSAFAAVFLLIYLPVVELEEQHLRSLFRNMPITPARPAVVASTRRIPWELSMVAIQTELEYQALAGFLAA